MLTGKEVKFLLYREKFLELLEAGRSHDALLCLQQDVAPCGSDAQAVQLLGQALMLDIAEVKMLFHWAGAAQNRAALVNKLERGVCSGWLLPPHRLDDLLRQALQAQRDTCLYHNSPDAVMSLLRDHTCGRSGESDEETAV